MNNYKNLFEISVKKLKIAGFRNPISDCRKLFNHCAASDAYKYTDSTLLDKHTNRIFDFAVRRRLSQEPVSHIIGYKDFWKTRFYVNQSVLDPRPETELIVEKVVRLSSSKLSVLDLGTGTGCIAISIALEKADLEVFASDISLEALRVAKFNAKELGARVSFIHSDWFANIKNTFDVIVSNPPYVCTSDLISLPLTVQRFEPRLALAAGELGLDCFRKIASKLNDYLNPGGIGVFEIGFNQMGAIKNLFETHGFKQIDSFFDLEGKERVVCVKKDA